MLEVDKMQKYFCILPYDINIIVIIILNVIGSIL